MIWMMTFQHTAARRRLGALSCLFAGIQSVSTHSRPKAAGSATWFSHSLYAFQHTAARRRLGCVHFFGIPLLDVSTHSRPKAAGNSIKP